MSTLDNFVKKKDITLEHEHEVNLKDIYNLFDQYNFDKLTDEQYHMLKIIHIKLLLFNSEVIGIHTLYDIPYEEDIKTLKERYNILSNLLIAMFNTDSIKIDPSLFLAHYEIKAQQNPEKKDPKYIEILLTKAFMESQNEDKLKRFLSS